MPLTHFSHNSNLSQNEPNPTDSPLTPTTTMKLKQFFQSATFLLVVLINMLFLSSLPGADARGYRRACTALGHGQEGTLEMLPRHRASMVDHMSEIFSVPVALNSLLEQQQRQVVASMNRSSPRYNIVEDENMMELMLDLPGVRAEDVSIALQEGGKVLKITGSRKYRRQQHGRVITSEFDQVFTIDPSILDVEEISANLSDGVLVVSVPKLSGRVESSQEREIQITGQQSIAESVIKVPSSKEGGTNDNNHAGEIEAETDGLEIMEEEDIE